MDLFSLAWQERSEATSHSKLLFITPCFFSTPLLHFPFLRDGIPSGPPSGEWRSLQMETHISSFRLKLPLPPSSSDSPKQRRGNLSGLAVGGCLGQVSPWSQLSHGCARGTWKRGHSCLPRFLNGCPAWDDGKTRTTSSGW